MNTIIEEVPMKFHPRAFSAFGSDLVTNDCVAIAELVKNSYDAFASKVTVSISTDSIIIQDDGFGMTGEIIKNAWAVIATPYKQKSPIVEKGEKIRRVSGNKGLGRFSAARLGRYLKIITRSDCDGEITANIDWERFVNSESMSDCRIIMTRDTEVQIERTGTIICISGLYDIWDNKKIEDLKNSLARLLSPFDHIDDFSIDLNYESYDAPIEIKPHAFIQKPTYSISGKVDDKGNISWNYHFSPHGKDKLERNGTVSWKEAYGGFDSPHNINDEEPDEYIAGEFGFEIRAWDLDSDSIADVAEAFNIGKREIRSNIAQYKGLSVYRDNVLVLPKSDASKDWLGIDIRRISQIGKRLSTSQIIGMVNISAENNPEIKDTTDREKLVDTPEYNQFCKAIESIISLLENLRYDDKKAPEKAPRGLNDLISPLSATPLVAKIEEAAEKGKSTDEILEAVRDYAAENEKTLGELNERLTYYAQTASLGSVAVVILHEILTGMTVIKRFLKRIRNKFTTIDEKTVEYLEDSENWHSRLVDVANSFAPLYRRTLRNEHSVCNLSEEIEKSKRLIASKKESADVHFIIDTDPTINVSVHPGELQTVFVNLLDNAVYWLAFSKKENPTISVKVTTSGDKARVIISDSGVGITREEPDKIFQPGITSKPHGIGMGLVIVTEILHNYNCKIATILPGELGGATFEFDLPIERN